MTRTLPDGAFDGVPALPSLAGQPGAPDAPGGELEGAPDRFRNPRIAQLTSRRTARENAETFQQLAHPQGDDACLDAVWATLHSMRNVEGAGSLKVHDWPPRA